MSELKQDRRDFKDAVRQVGADPAKWLLDFAYRDLARLKQHEVTKVAFEVMAFEWLEAKREAAIDPGDFRARWLATAEGYSLDIYVPHYRKAGLFSKKTTGLLAVFQQEVKQRFENCRLNHDAWEFLNPPMIERFDVFQRLKKEQQKFYFAVSAGTPLEGLLTRATSVVKRERERFAICQSHRCGSPFVAKRPQTAKYCSRTCASYVNVNRMRGKL